MQVATGIGIKIGVPLESARTIGQRGLNLLGTNPRDQFRALPIRFRHDPGQIIDEAVPQAGLDRLAS